MAHDRLSKRLGRPVSFITDYARADENENSADSLVIPEDLSTLSDEDLSALSEQAQEAFTALYGEDGSTLTPEEFTTLETLTEGIESLNAEQESRDQAAAERAEAAAALASRVRPVEDTEDTEDSAESEESEDDEDSDESTDEAEEDTEVTAEDEDEQAEALAASGRRRGEVRVNLSSIRGRSALPRTGSQSTDGPSIADYAFSSSESGGSTVGAPMDFLAMGRSIDHRLRSFNQQQYANAAAAGRRMRAQFGVASIQKPYGDLMLNSDSPADADEIMNRAVNQSALPGGSLVASGGWCAPSETIYDVYDCGETADGLISLPTIGVSRGGVRFNRGINFNDLLTQVGFHYTEDEDIAGDYDGEGGGEKPCFKIDCVDWEEERLELDGLCLTAGLLQAKGYPEVIADTVRKALVAHEIRMDSRRIAKIVAGSTAVSLPADQAGAAAPILTAIELQAQHYRSAGSLSDNTVLEAKFPQWVRGAIRSDLSRRLGVDLISVSNSRINQWFTDRLIVPQFLANYMPVGTTAAAEFTQWPTEAGFLLYKAGTWVGANSDVITLDTVYDSTLVKTNDYTALFTEEGTMTLMRGCDSRVVTVPICPDGATHGGVDIECDGSFTAA